MALDLVTNRWLEDGKKVEVRNAPTRFGAVNYSITSATSDRHIDADIQPPAGQQCKRMVIRIRHPEGKPMRAVTVNGKPHQGFDRTKECVNLPPAGERVIVRIDH